MVFICTWILTTGTCENYTTASFTKLLYSFMKRKWPQWAKFKFLTRLFDFPLHLGRNINLSLFSLGKKTKLHRTRSGKYSTVTHSQLSVSQDLSCDVRCVNIITLLYNYTHIFIWILRLKRKIKFQTPYFFILLHWW